MDNKQGFPDQKMNVLINLVSKKMGMQPDVLRAKLEDGSFDNMLKGLSEADTKKLSGIAEDPNKLDALLRDPKNKQMLSGILKNNQKRR